MFSYRFVWFGLDLLGMTIGTLFDHLAAHFLSLFSVHQVLVLNYIHAKNF